jgi:hypothetical protein
MEEACSSKYDFIQRHFSYNTPTHEQRIQGHITDEVIFEGLPKEHFQCLPDEIQLTLVEQYPHLGKYLDPEDVSPDLLISRINKKVATARSSEGITYNPIVPYAQIMP